jgi:hypothetical protein
VASYGCVCIAPDLSQLSKQDNELIAFERRAVVLVSCYAFLDSINATLFANQLDLSRVVLVGHSTGAGAQRARGECHSTVARGGKSNMEEPSLDTACEP